jgi:DNA-binding response OmpR family regulator
MLIYPAYGLFKFLKKKRLPEKMQQADTLVVPETDIRKEALNGKVGLRVGRSSLYMENQKLVSNGIEKDLTYREAKLLHLFSLHANQLLDRDLILKSVWEDEGIIVGRSVDVFVSRLRKLLKEDDSVRIVNVHGVGYRLEVQE